MASRCVGVMSKIATIETMHIFLERVLPWLGAIDDSTKQEGAIEALACILSQVKAELFLRSLPSMLHLYIEEEDFSISILPIILG